MKQRMTVGVPKETKTDEYRVAMLPVGVEELTRAGHRVLVQAGAGQGSGIEDERYSANGAEIVADAAAIWGAADLIVKVKEPLPPEYPLLRPGQIVFTYFHFAASAELTQAVLKSGCTAVAYETIRDARGNLPLLTPMSEVAGRMSIQQGAKYLERPFEGRGILLGGVPGVLPANVVILGGGIVGANAAKVASGLGANVILLDVNLDRLRYLDDVMPPNVTTLYSDRHNILDSIATADLVIGAVLIPGAARPEAGPARGPSPDAEAGGDHRRGDRSGGLLRDIAPDDALEADLHHRGHRPLLRREHAGRGGPDEQLRPVQRDSTLRAATREPGPGGDAGRSARVVLAESAPSLGFVTNARGRGRRSSCRTSR